MLEWICHFMDSKEAMFGSWNIQFIKWLLPCQMLTEPLVFGHLPFLNETWQL
jgi:hypothetical protein